MFGIGFSEIIIILIIVILLVKPDDIPNFIRKIGKIFGQLRRSYDTLIDTIRTLERKEIKPLKDAFTKEYKDAYEQDNTKKPKKKNSKKNTKPKSSGRKKSLNKNNIK